MPEVTIGLFPDAGGTWLLKNMPEHQALFIGMTGAHLNAGDAMLAGIGTHAVARSALEGLVAAHPDVFESVRGSGLMIGLKCKRPNAEVVQAGFANEVIVVPAADNVVRLLPPLNISDADIDEALLRLDRTAASLKTD